jgi:hypothetical protein
LVEVLGNYELEDWSFAGRMGLPKNVEIRRVYAYLLKFGLRAVMEEEDGWVVVVVVRVSVWWDTESISCRDISARNTS